MELSDLNGAEKNLFTRPIEVPDTNKNSFQNAWTYLERLKGEHEAAIQSEAMKSTFSGEDLIEKAKRLNERAEQEKNELIRRLKMRDEEKLENEENQTLVASKVEESQTLIAHEIPRSGKDSAVLTGIDSLGSSDVGYHHEQKKTVENSPVIASDYSLIEENLSNANRFVLLDLST